MFKNQKSAKIKSKYICNIYFVKNSKIVSNFICSPFFVACGPLRLCIHIAIKHNDPFVLSAHPIHTHPPTSQTFCQLLLLFCMSFCRTHKWIGVSFFSSSSLLYFKICHAFWSKGFFSFFFIQLGLRYFEEYSILLMFLLLLLHLVVVLLRFSTRPL